MNDLTKLDLIPNDGTLSLAVSPSDSRKVVMLRRGVMGYAPFRDFPDAITAEAFADRMNRQLGISEASVEARMCGSMFGWDSPGAKAAYEPITAPFRALDPVKPNA